MFKKLLSFLGLLGLLIAQEARASEHVTSFLSSGFMTAETGWTLTAGTKWTGASVQAKRLYRNDATILKGRTYRFSLTTQNVTTGEIQVVVGAPKSGSTGAWINVTCGSRGLCDVADNFTTASGLRGPISILPSDSSADPNGAFRFVTGVSKIANDDPMVFFGLPGASHNHTFVCNTGVNAFSTYQALRTSGGTSCGDPRFPVNRSAYWFPSMINGDGAAVIPYFVNVYYKAISASNPVCGAAPDATHIGFCVGIPNGLRYIAGFNFSTMGTDTNFGRWECHQRAAPDDRDPVANGAYDTIADTVAAGCPAGAVLYELMEGPICWDGLHVDSPDHRSHVHYPTIADGQVTINYTTSGTPHTASIAKCNASFPYQIPSFSMQGYWITDASFAAGKWHISSDEQMSPAVPAGTTKHMDYFEGWSPSVKDRWQTQCNDRHVSCSAGDLGDGSYIFTNRFSGAALSRYSAVPRTRMGFSAPLMGSGTFSGEVTATASGQFYLYSNDGWSGEVTAFSLTDVTPTNNHTSVTQHVTTH